MPTEPATLPRFEIRPLTDEEGGGYLVEFPDYPGCMADGETPEEALVEGRDALASYLDLEGPGPTRADIGRGLWRSVAAAGAQVAACGARAAGG